MKFNTELDLYWTYAKIDTEVFPPCGGGSCAVDSKKNIAYLFAGMTGHFVFSGSVFSFDMNTEEFKKVVDIPGAGRLNSRLFLVNTGELCLVGGQRSEGEPSPTPPVFFNELLFINPDNGETRKVQLSEDVMRRGQFCAVYDGGSLLYVYGGFNNSDFFSVDIRDGICTMIKPQGAVFDMRAGMAAELLPDGRMFIFSGFGWDENRMPVSFNDYYFYDPKKNLLEKKKCNEVVARTFSRSFYYPEKNKIMIALGSLNGMESSRALVWYDINEDFFLRLWISDFPVDLVEPFCVFSEKNNKMYLISGISGSDNGKATFSDYVFSLDFEKIPGSAWLPQH